MPGRDQSLSMYFSTWASLFPPPQRSFWGLAGASFSNDHLVSILVFVHFPLWLLLAYRSPQSSKTQCSLDWSRGWSGLLDPALADHSRSRSEHSLAAKFNYSGDVIAAGFPALIAQWQLNQHHHLAAKRSHYWGSSMELSLFIHHSFPYFLIRGRGPNHI